MKKTTEADHFFQYSLKLTNTDIKAYPEAVHNYSAFLIDQKEYIKASRVLNSYFDHDAAIDNSTPIGQRILLKKLIVLEALKFNSEAAEFAEETIRTIDFSDDIKLDFYNHLLCYYSNFQENPSRIQQIINFLDDLLITIPEVDPQIKLRTINNTAFASLICGNLVEGTKRILLISSSIHSDPFVTATFGLLKLRSGDIERGKQLYSEAIGLLRSPKDKGRFKQRMNFELGKTYLVSGDTTRATRCLSKARGVNHGTAYLNELINKQLMSLPRS